MKRLKNWHASATYAPETFSFLCMWWLLTKLICFRFWKRKHGCAVIFLRRHDLPPGTIEARFQWVEEIECASS